NNLGTLLVGLGKLPQADTGFRQARTLLKQLAADSPAVPEYRQELARSHNNLGNLALGLGNWPEAEAEYGHALTLKERLAAEFPTVPDYAVDQGGTYLNLGNLRRERGEAAASLDWYAKARATLRPVLDREPRLVTARVFLRNVHVGRAQALVRVGRHA